jgi:hypothetical protein
LRSSPRHHGLDRPVRDLSRQSTRAQTRDGTKHLPGVAPMLGFELSLRALALPCSISLRVGSTTTNVEDVSAVHRVAGTQPCMFYDATSLAQSLARMGATIALDRFAIVSRLAMPGCIL